MQILLAATDMQASTLMLLSCKLRWMEFAVPCLTHPQQLIACCHAQVPMKDKRVLFECTHLQRQ
jgi:hypothetical protein